MRRRSEARVESIDFSSPRRPEHEAAIADRPVVDTLEDELGPRVVAVRPPRERQTSIRALSRVADTDEPLWRPTAETPLATGLPGPGVVYLPRRRLPGPRAVLTAAHLDRMGRGGRIGGHPPEPVSSEIHQAPAAVDVRLEAVERRSRPVLGMASRQHDVVAPQQREPLVVEIVVGDDV